MSVVLKEKWSGLSSRERRWVFVAAIIVALGMLVGLAIEPALKGIARLQGELPLVRRDLATVKAYAEEARRLNSNATRGATIELATLPSEIEKSLARAGLKDQTKLMGTAQAPIVKLTGAPFASVMEWVAGAPRELSVRIQSTRLERAGGQGNVSGEITLEAPTAKATP
jgi:general secretion pathway protein M